MNVNISHPTTQLLRRRVEEQAGLVPRSLPDFGLLAEKISRECRERLSQSTLERLWQYSTRRKESVSLHTLDVLSRFVGKADWHDFCLSVATSEHPESDHFKDGVLDVASLPAGSRLRLGWLPDRLIEVKHLGDRRFVVEESCNSAISPGDTFESTQLQKGQPLYLDRYRSASDGPGSEPGRYVAGRNSGLTTLEVIA